MKIRKEYLLVTPMQTIWVYLTDEELKDAKENYDWMWVIPSSVENEI